MMVWGVNRTLWLWQSTINCVSPRWTTREIISWCMKSRPSTFLLLLLLMSSSVTSPRPQMSCPLRWLSGLTFRCIVMLSIMFSRMPYLIPRRARWLQAFVPAKQHHTWLKPCNKLIWIFRQLIVQTVGGTKTWFLVGTKSCSRTALSEVRWTSSYRFYIIRRGLTVWQLTPH